MYLHNYYQRRIKWGGPLLFFCIQKCPNPLINLIEHVSKDKRGNYSLTWQMILSWDRKCAGRNCILLPKLFWPTVRKNCFSDREIFWNSSLKAENFEKFLRSIEQFIQTVKGQNKFLVTECFFNMFLEISHI